MSAQRAEDEVSSTAKLLYDLTAQMLGFGPVLAAKMSYRSTICLPWGLGAAGAETVKQGVDTDHTEGVARMTADMVRLGMLGTVHDIVVSLCAQDRADAVAAVTAELLKQGEVVIVTRITNALVASSHAGEAVSISGELIKQGNTQIYEVIKESGLDMGMLGGGDGGKEGEDKEEGPSGSQEEGSSSDVLGDIQRKGAQVLERLTPQKEEPQKKAPDADALFNDMWSGEKKAKPPAEEGEDIPPKEERLL